MRGTYYLCSAKKAYKFALKNYANIFTQIAFCNILEDPEAASWLMFEKLNKKFYVFGCCRTGYIKMGLKNFLTKYPEKFDGYYIPYRAKKSPATGKPVEEHIRGKIVNGVIIPYKRERS